MSRDREESDEIAKRLKRETDVSSQNQMGRRHMLGQPGTLNTSTPCAACKLLRRRCAEECPFSPYFSPHEPQKFAAVHKVFGASNVSKMLMEVPESQRADAANSLVYEANVRLRDPVYGCMGAISALQQQIQTLQAELNAVRTEILKYKYKEATNNQNIDPLSHGTLQPSGAALVAMANAMSSQGIPSTPPPPPSSSPPSSIVAASSSSSTSNLYTQPTSSINIGYSSISNSNNMPYFE